MCSVAGAAVGLSIGGGLLGYSGQKKAAKAQNRYNQQQYAQEMAYRAEQEAYQLEQYLENAERAADDVRRNYKEIDQRIQEEGVVAALEIEEFFRQGRQMQSSELSVAAERGVEGATVDNLMDNIKYTELRAVSNVKQEQQWRLNQYASMKEQVEALGEARVESMNPQPIPLPALPQHQPGPNAFATMLNIGSQALNVYNSFASTTNPTTATATATTPMNYLRGNLWSGGISQGSFGPIGGYRSYSVKPSWVN